MIIIPVCYLRLPIIVSPPPPLGVAVTIPIAGTLLKQPHSFTFDRELTVI
jgi:hypothetical protein